MSFRVRKTSIFVAAALVVVLQQACNGDCVSLGIPGIVITVTDATTQASPTAAPSLRVTDGSFVENFAKQPFDKNPPEFSAAVERPGVYAVLVRAEGYQDFVRGGVRVSRSDAACAYLNQVRINARLVRNYSGAVVQ